MIRKANSEEVILLSPSTVKDELQRVLKTKLDWNEEETSSLIRNLPTVWVPREEYSSELPQAKSLIPHKEDSPILACALKLETIIITGNTNHFNKPEIRKKTPIWTSRKLLNYLESKKNKKFTKANHKLLFPVSPISP
ncbi:MAG: PIN domain-containing protein [Thermoproteota archaeon]